MPHRSACARIRGRYVLRPSGKCRHTSQSQRPSPAVRGSKTGLVLRRPFAFCCLVGSAGLSCLFICCRFAVLLAAEVHFIFRGNVTPPLSFAGRARQQKSMPDTVFSLPHTTLESKSGFVASRPVLLSPPSQPVRLRGVALRCSFPAHPATLPIRPKWLPKSTNAYYKRMNAKCTTKCRVFCGGCGRTSV